MPKNNSAKDAYQATLRNAIAALGDEDPDSLDPEELKRRMEAAQAIIQDAKQKISPRR